MTSHTSPLHDVTGPSTRIHLIRHGTTMLNRLNRYRGRRDVALDQGGWEDAWRAANELEHAGLTAIYSSPLRRARDTARIVGDVAGVEPVIDLPGLTNLEYGAWEGLTSDEARAHDPVLFEAYQQAELGAYCPGGESLELAERRVLLSLQTIAALHPGETVAAVSHAAIVRLAIIGVGAKSRAEWRTVLPNGSVTTFDVVDGVVSLHRLPVAA
jgi:broad specificity phosphatase PhoE